MSEQNRRIFERWLQGFERRGGIKRAFVAEAGPNPAKGAISRHLPGLTIFNAGKQNVWNFRSQGRLCRIKVKAGDAFYMEKDAWIAFESYASDNLALSLVYYTDHLRFTQRKDGEKINFETSGPVRRDGWHMRQAIELAARERAGEQSILEMTRALLSLSREEMMGDAGGVSSGAAATWHAVCEYIHDHVDEDLSREKVAGVFDIHPAYLSRLFSEEGRGGYHRHILNLRMQRAANLLAGPGISIREVGERTGFPDPSYFIKVFKRVHGVSPARYRDGLVI